MWVCISARRHRLPGNKNDWKDDLRDDCTDDQIDDQKDDRIDDRTVDRIDVARVQSVYLDTSKAVGPSSSSVGISDQHSKLGKDCYLKNFLSTTR